MLTGGRKAAGAGFDGIRSCVGHLSQHIPAFPGVSSSVSAAFWPFCCSGQLVSVSSYSSSLLQSSDSPFSPALHPPSGTAALPLCLRCL